MQDGLRIGVDFDNTLVCCDALFHDAAREQGLIPASVPITKAGIRDYLRAVGNEDEWTRLQGYVYGVRIVDAPAFPGALDFLRRAAGAGVPVCVVSHRTRHPYIGPRYDLHRAALAWMEKNGLFNECGLNRERVFLETTKHEKLARIGSLTCTHFVDDLPEILAEPAFPRTTQPILFDPDGEHESHAAFRRIRSWQQLERELLAA